MTGSQARKGHSGLRSYEWQDDAACRDIPPESFFPMREQGGGNSPAQEQKRAEAVKRAQSVCARCVTQAECALAALNADEKSGIFAGIDMEMDHRPRGKLRRLARYSRVTTYGTLNGPTAAEKRLVELIATGEPFSSALFAPAIGSAVVAGLLRSAVGKNRIEVIGRRTNPLNAGGSRLLVYRAVS